MAGLCAGSERLCNKNDIDMLRASVPVVAPALKRHMLVAATALPQTLNRTIAAPWRGCMRNPFSTCFRSGSHLTQGCDFTA